jgi:hypothetical protein
MSVEFTHHTIKLMKVVVQVFMRLELEVHHLMSNLE